MAYNINLTNGSPVVINDNVVDTSQFSIPLLGRNYTGYGGEMATALLHMLEHFANDVEPDNPTSGQIWFNRSNETLFVRNDANDDWLQILIVDSDGNLEICGNILPCADDTYDIGSSSLRWKDIYASYLYGVAQGADYSDLAERYHADKSYVAGTVVKIGGDKEITETDGYCDPDTFSVISSLPGLMLNVSAGPNDTHPYVALSGGVPVRVTGPVKKGQRLVASDVPGVAVATDDSAKFGYAIGRALESKKSEEEDLVLAFVSAIR